MVEDETGIENDINYISELKGQFFLNPVLSISLTICLFSMAGIPPLIGFFLNSLYYIQLFKMDIISCLL
jgi:NADH:ubiquinone oxidoreductase subunit 2 (subunit N)